jgi:hypothetical protein
MVVARRAADRDSAEKFRRYTATPASTGRGETIGAIGRVAR